MTHRLPAGCLTSRGRANTSDCRVGSHFNQLTLERLGLSWCRSSFLSSLKKWNSSPAGRPSLTAAQARQPVRSFGLANGATKSASTLDSRVEVKLRIMLLHTCRAFYDIPAARHSLLIRKRKKKRSFAVAKRFPVVFRLPLRLF